LNRLGTSLDAAYQAALGGTHPPTTAAQRRSLILRQQTSKPQLRILLGVFFVAATFPH
jgi:hypothetical protein